MRRLLVLSAALLALGFSAGLVSAATITVSPNYGQAYDSTFAAIGTPTANGSASVPLNGYVQVDVQMTLSGTSSTAEDFWTAIFNIGHSAGLTPVQLASSFWMNPATAQANGVTSAAYSFPAAAPSPQSYSQYDANGSSPGGVNNIYQNGDADVGTDANDLQAIAVEATATEAFNRNYGVAGRPVTGYPDQLGTPTLFGTVVFQVTSAGPQSISLSPITGAAWGLYEGNNAAGAGVATGEQSGFTGGTLLVNAAPEPASLILLGMSGLGLVAFARRRRS